MTDFRTPEEIAADLNSTRERLVSGLDELVSRSQPEVVAKQQLEKVKAFYMDEHGQIRQDRALKTAGIVLGLAILRKLFK